MSISSVTPNQLNSGQTVWFGTAPPTTSDAAAIGPAKVGDIVVNTAPTSGTPPFWVCTAAGTLTAAGTWEAQGSGTEPAIFNGPTNASLVTQAFFANGAQVYLVAGVTERHSVAGTDGGAVTIDVTNDATTVAPGVGVSLLAAPFNAKATANVTQAGTLTATTANLTIAAGSAISVKFTGTLTALAGVIVKVVLQKVN